MTDKSLFYVSATIMEGRKVLDIGRFRQKVSAVSMNERQHKVVKKLLELGAGRKGRSGQIAIVVIHYFSISVFKPKRHSPVTTDRH